MPRLAHNPGSRPRRPENTVAELAVEIQADLTEVERDAAAVGVAAAKARGPRRDALLAQWREMTLFLRAAHRRAFRIGGISSQVEEEAAA